MKNFVFLVAALFVIGCGDDAQLNKTFTGHYESGFENSSFTACEERENWWVQGEVGKLSDFLDDQANFPADTSVSSGITTETHPERLSYKRAFTKLRGDLSAEGRYGHLGAASRLLTVKEVVWVQKESESDCN